MSLKVIQQSIDNKKMRCPQCSKAVKQFEKYTDMVGTVWDGAGDSHSDTSGSKVTLICGNEGCDWRERTEYWANYIDEDA